MKILVQDPAFSEEAAQLAAKLQVETVTDPGAAAAEEQYLSLGADGLSLVQGKMALRGDFTELLPRITGGHLQHEKLLRAVKLKDLPERPLAVDCTAGLGEDSFIIAAAGFSVILCEYNPVICALLRDALERAKRDPGTAETAGRMELREGNSIDVLASLSEKPDVIYLDPMFPEKQKSGVSTKKLQLFKTLEAPCSDEVELMEAAVSAGPRRIVVKRPVKGPFLAGKKAGHSIVCRNIRYDCYTVN